jgi:hypothetical protein
MTLSVSIRPEATKGIRANSVAVA